MYAVNKPVGVLSKPEEPGLPAVTDLIPEPQGIVSGRLDKDSSGLIIVTTDGRYG